MTSTKEMQRRASRERQNHSKNKRTIRIVEAIQSGCDDAYLYATFKLSPNNIRLWRKAVARMKLMKEPQKSGESLVSRLLRRFGKGKTE